MFTVAWIANNNISYSVDAQVIHMLHTQDRFFPLLDNAPESAIQLPGSAGQIVIGRVKCAS